jgi:hypothetical protein
VVRRADLPGQSWPETVELRLADRPLSISGVVLDAAGKPHAHAAVWVDDPTYFAVKDEFALSAEHQMERGELLWRRYETDEAGRFEITGLLDREYEVCAVDCDTTDVVTLPGVRAGSADVALRFRPGTLLAELNGCIVDGSGAPVGDVVIRVTHFVFTYHGGMGDQSFLCQEYGPATETDEQGRFTLRNLPRSGITLQLAGRDLMTDDYRFPGDVVTTPVEIVVARRCRVRIDVSGSDLARADQAQFVDAGGADVLLMRDTGDMRYIERRTALTAGRTEVLFVPDNAAMAVFVSEGEEIGRLPLRPTPGEIAVVRP